MINDTKLDEIGVKLKTSIRLGEGKDLPFIMDSWVKTVKHTYPNMYALDFSHNYFFHIQKILSSSIVLISHLEGEPEEIVSYMVYSSFRGNQVIHFAYVKSDARREGQLKQMIKFSQQDLEKHLPIVFTVAPKNENVMIALCSKYIFDPSLSML